MMSQVCAGKVLSLQSSPSCAPLLEWTPANSTVLTNHATSLKLDLGRLGGRSPLRKATQKTRANLNAPRTLQPIAVDERPVVHQGQTPWRIRLL